MSNRALATLAVRLLGVYAWFQVVSHLPQYVYYLTSSFEGLEFDRLPIAIVGGAVLLLWVLAGFALIFRSPWFTRLLLKDLDETESGGGAAGGLQAILFSVIGVALVAGALPEVVSLLVRHFTEEDREISYLESRWPQAASLGVLLLVGIGLFLGARGLSRIWRRLGEMNRAP